MATCASAMGGSGGAMAAAAAAGAKRECVCVCKICYAKMADYTVRITGWALKKKSQFYRALNHYLGSLQSLKHTCHLRIRLGGFCRSRKLRKNRRNASVFASEFFRKRNQANGEFFSNERFLVVYTLSELLAVRRPDERRRRRLLGCWAACLSLGSPVWKNPKHTSK
jgi:hypothetical protein